jgi:hypothetical protein
MGKAVGLLGEAEPGLARLTSDVLMTVEHYLGRERRVTANLNSDVAPLGIEDVKGIVVYEKWRVSRCLEPAGDADPDRGRRRRPLSSSGPENGSSLRDVQQPDRAEGRCG